MIKKTGYYAFYFIFSLLFLWIFFASFSGADGSFKGKFITTAAFRIILAAAGIFCAGLREISEKSYKRTVRISLLLFFVMLTVFGCITMTYHLSDLEVLVEAADYMLQNGDILPYSAYFTVCENTLGNRIFIYLIFLPMKLSGIDIHRPLAECFGIAVNCRMIVLSVYLWLKITEKSVKNRNFSLLFLFLSILYIPYYLWAHRYYSDTLSLAFIPLTLLLFEKSCEEKERKGYVYRAIAAFSLWTGYFIRGSVAICLPAIIIFSLFSTDKEKIKKAFSLLLSFIVIVGVRNYVIKHNRYIDYSDYEVNKYPAEMWLMYGAHDDGNYNDPDVDLLREYPDLSSRREIAKEKLKEYYSEYTLKTYIQFLTHKFGITWGSGMFDSEKYLCEQRDPDFTYKFLVKGQPLYASFRYICDGLQLALMAFCRVSPLVMIKKKEYDITMLSGIILLGNALFLCFWETKARYAFSSMPIVLFLVVFFLHEVLKNKIK